MSKIIKVRNDKLKSSTHLHGGSVGSWGFLFLFLMLLILQTFFPYYCKWLCFFSLVCTRCVIKNNKECLLWWSSASLQSYWNVKFMKNVYVSLCQHFLRTWSCNNSVRKHGSLTVVDHYSTQYQSLWPMQILQFLPNINQMVQMVSEPSWPQI